MKYIVSLLALALTLMFSGCGSSSSSTPPQTPVLQSITVTPASSTLDIGTTQDFKATGFYSDGTNKDITATAVWSLENNNGTVTLSGSQAKAVKEGNDRVVATVGTISGTANITVVEAALISFQITPQKADILVGKREQFKAEGNYSDGHSQDLSDEATWTSNDDSVAQLENGTTNKAWVGGIAAGDAVITASFDGMSDTADVHVYKEAEIDYIKITPVDITLTLGKQQKYEAKAYLDNGDVDDITRDTDFRSQNDSIAQFSTTSNSSTLTAKGVGTTTVVARYLVEEFEDETSVTVVE